MKCANPECGKAFAPYRNHQTYCSVKCQRRVWHFNNVTALRAKECKTCGKDIGHKRSDYCSADCKHEAYKKNHREYFHRNKQAILSKLAIIPNYGKHIACTYCGQSFKVGQRTKYCSTHCYKTVSLFISREKKGINPTSSPIQVRECKACRKRFTDNLLHDNREHCSLKCQQQHAHTTYGYNKKNANTLSDKYIKGLLTKHTKHLKASDIPQDLITVTREHIKIKRLLKQETHERN